MAGRVMLRRYLIFSLGVVVCALGIGFITRAGLGTSPISSVPFVMSLITPPTMGVYTLVFNLFFLGVEALLRRSFTRAQVLQIPATLLFSLCIDGAMWLIPTQLYGAYPVQVIYLLFGCCLMGIGITLEVFGGVIMLPGEAVVRALSDRTGREFSKVKVVFDGGLTVLAVLLSLFAFGRLNGVKEGTVVAALLVGRLVGFFSSRLGFLKGFLAVRAVAVSAD